MKALTLLLVTIALATAPLHSAPAKKPTTTGEPPCCRVGLPPGKFSEKSFYRLDSTWTADVGKEVKLSALRGRPQVLALFFASCSYSCPLIVKEMKTIEAALPPALRERVDFLLVSIDPDRDTPKALRAFRKKYDLSPEHWSLLTGKAKDIRTLADRVGFRYSPGSTLQYAHSILITILDADGVIVFQQVGLGNTPDNALAALAKIPLPKTKPTQQ